MRTAKLLGRIQSKSVLNANKQCLKNVSMRQFNDIWQPRSQFHRFLLKQPLEPLFCRFHDIHHSFEHRLFDDTSNLNTFMSNSMGMCLLCDKLICSKSKFPN